MNLPRCHGRAGARATVPRRTGSRRTGDSWEVPVSGREPAAECRSRRRAGRSAGHAATAAGQDAGPHVVTSCGGRSGRRRAPRTLARTLRPTRRSAFLSDLSRTLPHAIAGRDMVEILAQDWVRSSSGVKDQVRSRRTKWSADPRQRPRRQIRTAWAGTATEFVRSSFGHEERGRRREMSSPRSRGSADAGRLRRACPFVRPRFSAAQDGPRGGSAFPDASIEGVLVASDRSGLGIAVAGGEVRYVVWPPGYGAARTASGLILLDEHDQVVAHVDDRVRSGGWNQEEGRWFSCRPVLLAPASPG